MNHEPQTTNDEPQMMNDERQTTNDERRTKNEERRKNVLFPLKSLSFLDHFQLNKESASRTALQITRSAEEKKKIELKSSSVILDNFEP